MNSLYLIPWIFYGFIYCKKAYRAKFNSHKYSTQYFLYTVLTYGTISIIPSFAIVSIVSVLLGKIFEFLGFHTKINSFYEFFKNFSGGIENNYLEVIFICFIGYLITIYIINKHNDKDSEVIRKKLSLYKDVTNYEYRVESYVYLSTLNNDPIKEKIARNFFHNSNSKTSPQFLMFDIGKDKVYVGIVVKIGMPSDNHLPESIAITPFLSGYRDEEKRVVFTTDYKGQEYSETIFKESDILSVKDFNEEIYNGFQHRDIKIRKPLRRKIKK